MQQPNYNSAATSKSCKRKQEISQIAQDSFDAIQPFINIFDCGIVGSDGCFHLITKEDWRLYARHKAGEKHITYQDGTNFNPYLDVVRNIFSSNHVHRHIEEKETTYYTSGKKGFGLLYLDIDAHHPWQTDEYKALAVLKELFPFGYYRASGRGQNGYLKIRYTSIQQFNGLADSLQELLKRYFRHLGIFCDIEVKGTITDKNKSGRLAKLPFTNKYHCDMKDETDNWNYPELEKFKACPIVNARRVECIALELEPQIDEEKVQQFSEYKRALDDQEKQERDEKVKRERTAPTRTVAASSPASPAPAPKLPQKLPKPSPKTPQKKSGSGDGDAFVRNRKDLLPFVREFYKRNGSFPEVEDALAFLHAKGLYSGRWEDKESRRARRVQQILNFIEQTFDPKEMSNGKGPAIILRLGRFSWWVRQHFGWGMKAHATDLRRFDPIEMTAPVVDVAVPARFIETFLVVADACLRQDPLENQAVPTSRIKKIWSMVQGGARWNQHYFQIVRDRLDRMGIIKIWDKKHESGKAWRWKPGSDFPEDSFKETDRKFKKEHRLPPGLAPSFEELLAGKKKLEMNKVHNTLYQEDACTLRLWDHLPQVRPPP